MKQIKRIMFIVFMLFFITGCSIYSPGGFTGKQTYYPDATNGNLGEEFIESEPTQERVRQSSNSVIPQPLATQNQEKVSTVKPDGVKSVDRTVVKRIPFPEAEYKSLAKKGNATVEGRIYVVTPTGNKIYGKRVRLYLNPVTSYSTQWYKESYLKGAKMSEVDSRLFNYIRFTTSDNNGNFKFMKVPSGSYYVVGVVKCGSECGYSKQRVIKIAKKISVFGNEVKVINLDKNL